MNGFLYRWLPIVFGCHCRPERSFYFHGKQFPVCARCTGELAGILFLSVTYAIYHPPILYALIFLIPMILDGGIQLLTRYESTNIRRFFTGLFFGYGFFYLIAASLVATYWIGYHKWN
ncbi:DUF2085 domain-containing protein [Lacrimispora sp.]|jgi:uncharacterized membrane protein|uniref:DUF2085 domain-containing protein n=1 Tax=Lacrimispora TaxID=2719231 RepID=UPI000BE45C12